MARMVVLRARVTNKYGCRILILEYIEEKRGMEFPVTRLPRRTNER